MAIQPLRSFRSSLVAYVGVSLAIGTVVACYLLALAKYKTHLPRLPIPFISDLGVYPPEVQVFRIGFVLTPAVFAMQAAIVYSADRDFSRKIGLALGTISSMCLMVVAVVSEAESMKVHGAFAVGFFGLFVVYMVLITWWSRKDKGVSRISKIIKTVATITGIVAFLCMQLGFLIYKEVKAAGAGPESDIIWMILQLTALCEWISVVAIVIFQVTLGTDLSNVKISVSDSDEKKQD